MSYNKDGDVIEGVMKIYRYRGKGKKLLLEKKTEKMTVDEKDRIELTFTFIIN